VKDRAAIEARIPHREPFLFVDRIVEECEDGILCEWRVPPDADWFRGHYPGRPVTPGVILSEHVFQCAALYVSGRLDGFDAGDGVPVLTKIEGARFKRMVDPGDELSTRITLTERLGPAWYLAGKVTGGGKAVLNIRFVLSATEAMKRVTGEEA
jgi:3-hydroxyacyl-[acyl-carrier-protein] dehydratase